MKLLIKFGNTLTKIDIENLKGKSIYSEYQIGDKIGYVGLVDNDTVHIQSIVERDIDRFLKEYDTMSRDGYYIKKINGE